MGDLGRYEEALKVLDGAIRMDRSNATGYNNKAFVLNELRRHQAAAAAAHAADCVRTERRDSPEPDSRCLDVSFAILGARTRPAR